MAKRRYGNRGGYGQYVSVARRRELAAQEAAAANKRGKRLDPVHIAGRSIATTTWGRAWCDHIEDYHDYANRLGRGRTYVRNGSVYHLAIARGEIVARVMGSSRYQQRIKIETCKSAVWKRVRKRCSGGIGSLIELLEGRISSEVMTAITAERDGLLPNLREVQFSCSCPDGAIVCKHIAAVLYGVGARLDERPELLFTLRGVDPSELIDEAVVPARGAKPASGAHQLDGDLASVFGIELDEEAPEPRKKPAKRTKKKTASRKSKTVSRRKVNRQDLMDAGVPSGTIDSWLQQDVLERTSERGLYQHTPESRARMKRYGA